MRPGGALSKMSIINDALKKVQTNININTKPTASATLRESTTTISSSMPEAVPIRKKTLASHQKKATGTTSWTPQNRIILAVVILLLVSAAALVVLLPKLTHTSAETNSLAKAAPSTPPPSLPSHPDRKINGVMTTGQKNVVLINDTVYEEGEEVDGIKILKIYHNNVVVSENGQEKVLKVR